MIRRATEEVVVGEKIIKGMTARKLELNTGEVLVRLTKKSDDRDDISFMYSLPDDNGGKLKKSMMERGIIIKETDYANLAFDIKEMCMSADYIKEEKKDSYNVVVLKDYLSETAQNIKYIWKRQLLALHSLAAPINEIYSEHDGRFNPILLVIGKSSTGKSSACKYVQSLSCDINDPAYTTDMTDTKMAILQRMTGIQGYPVLLDDTSNRSNQDFESLLYLLATGKERERVAKRNHVYENDGGGNFDCNFTITGEVNPLLGRKTKSGVDRRTIVLKVYNGELTDSAKHSRTLRFESMHYGNVSLRDKIVELILRDGPEAVFDKIKSKTDRISEELHSISSSNVLNGWDRYFAVLELTSEYLEEITGIKCNFDRLKFMCLEIIKRRIRMSEELSDEEMFNDIYEEVVNNCSLAQTNTEHFGITSKEFKKVLINVRDIYGENKKESWIKNALLEEGLLESTKSKVVAGGGSKNADRYYFIIRKEGDNRHSTSEADLEKELEQIDGGTENE